MEHPAFGNVVVPCGARRRLQLWLQNRRHVGKVRVNRRLQAHLK